MNKERHNTLIRVLWCTGLVLSYVQVTVAKELPWLRARGTMIVDEQKRPVVLRGFNLGGWLVEEMWMMPFETKPPSGSPFKEIKDHVTLWNTLSSRLGPAQAQRIRVALRNAWMTEADFDRIRAAGFNCVRLPFLYDQLYAPEGLYPWLDKALNWARQRGLYVILDMHGAPGRQSKDHHSGEEGRNMLFRDPRMVQQTATIWKQIARRYRNRPEVAGYDLLNEPMGAQSNSTLHLVHDRLYQAIRSVDKRHLIFIEDGYKGIEHMPHPSLFHWHNVVFSLHSYKFDAKNEQDHLKHLEWLVSTVDKHSKERMVPFYLGEFNLEPHGNPTIMAQFIKAMEQKGWSWSLWTYKVAGQRGGRSLWGWYYPPRSLQAIDLFRDSADQIMSKIPQIRTENLVPYPELGKALLGTK